MAVAQSGLQTVSTDPDGLDATLQSVQAKHLPIQAIMISADALASLEDGLHDRLRKISQQDHLPVLLFDITEQTNPAILRKWSQQHLSGCRNQTDKYGRDTTIRMSQDKRNGPLAGVDISSPMRPTCTLVRDGAGEADYIVTTGTSHQVPVLARVENVFFAPRLEAIDAPPAMLASSISEVFSSVAPFVVFLRDVSGEYAWHIDGHYANFTIDDPWLIQPYGNLDYLTLLAAMKEHRFHTTIAFVPWNYNRSKPDLVAVFRQNPRYYSVSLHGNNHTHREFGEYSENPLAKQTEDIKQAVARMEKFRSMTGLSYDRFMVFPHGVAPEATFAQLNKYGFLGTANSLNVPLDRGAQENPLDRLRPYTTKYGGLLSLFRYSAEAPISETDLAVSAYLGNPILVYAHQEAFQGGNAFITEVVDRINKLVPDAQWVSLGNLARHLYLQRKHSGGEGVDVRMLSHEAVITNNAGTAAKFYIELPADSSGTAGVRIDGNSIALGKNTPVEMEIPAGQSRMIAVERGGEAELADTVIDKGGPRAYILRWISDVRDLYLSRIGPGRAVIQWYYSYRADSIELFFEQRWKYILSVFVVIGALVLRFRKTQTAR